MRYAARITRLRHQLDHPILVTNLVNVRYLTGFTGSNGFLYVQPDGATFVTDGRYGELASGLTQHLPDTNLVVYTDRAFDHLAAVIGGASKVGLEAGGVTWAFMRALRENCTARLVPTEGVVEQYRRIKDEDELEALRSAAAAGDAAFSALGSLLDVATTESELGDLLIDAMQGAGARRAAWEPIVAADANSASPHHRAGSGFIGDGVLLLDYGCVVDGYHSDMTRTVVIDRATDPEFDRVYDAVLESNRAGIEAVKPGVIAGDVDEVCRDVLRRYGYEDHFIHSTGHGVGLEIHEAPSIKKGSDDVLEVGQVVTVEPGVYLPGRFGVRVEDMVVVTESGGEVLTRSDRRPRL